MAANTTKLLQGAQKNKGEHVHRKVGRQGGGLNNSNPTRPYPTSSTVPARLPSQQSRVVLPPVSNTNSGGRGGGRSVPLSVTMTTPTRLSPSNSTASPSTLLPAWLKVTPPTTPEPSQHNRTPTNKQVERAVLQK